MSARKSKKAIKARRQVLGYKGFMPLEEKKALDARSVALNVKQQQVLF